MFGQHTYTCMYTLLHIILLYYYFKFFKFNSPIIIRPKCKQKIRKK